MTREWTWFLCQGLRVEFSRSHLGMHHLCLLSAPRYRYSVFLLLQWFSVIPVISTAFPLEGSWARITNGWHHHHLETNTVLPADAEMGKHKVLKLKGRVIPCLPSAYLTTFIIITLLWLSPALHHNKCIMMEVTDTFLTFFTVCTSWWDNKFTVQSCTFLRDWIISIALNVMTGVMKIIMQT